MKVIARGHVVCTSLYVFADPETGSGVWFTALPLQIKCDCSELLLLLLLLTAFPPNIV